MKERYEQEVTSKNCTFKPQINEKVTAAKTTGIVATAAERGQRYEKYLMDIKPVRTANQFNKINMVSPNNR